MQDDVLVVMALPQEGQGVFEAAEIPVIYTGLGKVNAAFAVTRAVTRRRPRLVLNFGTAGSHRFARHTLVACHRFVQRDMDVSGLGFERGVTPFEEIPSVVEHPLVWPDLPNGTCGSADRFETATFGSECDLVDMEAFALAKVCLLENIRFGCAKYVTDGADGGAAEDWQANLPRAARLFLEAYQRATGILTGR